MSVQALGTCSMMALRPGKGTSSLPTAACRGSTGYHCTPRHFLAFATGGVTAFAFAAFATGGVTAFAAFATGGLAALARAAGVTSCGSSPATMAAQRIASGGASAGGCGTRRDEAADEGAGRFFGRGTCRPTSKGIELAANLRSTSRSKFAGGASAGGFGTSTRCPMRFVLLHFALARGAKISSPLAATKISSALAASKISSALAASAAASHIREALLEAAAASHNNHTWSMEELCGQLQRKAEALRWPA